MIFSLKLVLSSLFSGWIKLDKVEQSHNSNGELRKIKAVSEQDRLLSKLVNKLVWLLVCFRVVSILDWKSKRNINTSSAEVSEIQGEKSSKPWATPKQPKRLGRIGSYFFLARDPSCECFQGHRGEFWISSWKPRYGHIRGFLRGQIGVQKFVVFGLYLGS